MPNKVNLNALYMIKKRHVIYEAHMLQSSSENNVNNQVNLRACLRKKRLPFPLPGYILPPLRLLLWPLMVRKRMLGNVYKTHV